MTNKKTFKAFVFFNILFLFIAAQSIAQVKMASIFTNNLVLQQEAKVPIWGWTKPGENVSVLTSWNKQNYNTKADENGKFKVYVNTPKAGGPYEITIKDKKSLTISNILIGEVWILGGQSNMEMTLKGMPSQPVLGANEAILRSKNPNIRLYVIPRAREFNEKENSKPSSWKSAEPESVANFSAAGYFFGNLVQESLNVPIGLINVNYGGSNVEAWMSRKDLKEFNGIELPKVADSATVNNRSATALYNGMLHPIIGYGIKGALFYQGESNYDRPDQYETLFPAMVKEWRTKWQQGDFPFYYVQIAPFDYRILPPHNSGGKYNSAYLRDAQRKALDKIPNSGMVSLIDLGEKTSIHPMHKKECGERLAFMALGKTYGIKGIAYEAPTYDAITVEGSTVTIKFKNAKMGLTSYSKEMVNFEIAGKDQIFHPAKAKISRDIILLSSPEVKEPIAVRYAFSDFVVGDLFSTDGLAISSFRTDNFEK
ncbi:sialate O-acetylesterase [Pedobacter alpinus]|uniref:Sialate O-acetylesterase n=1 Tax=Pedobacter alpinus TaxID=1590643 RepID=A0ABW5TS47_9SPHI